ncbi:MAG: 1-acyl-sn-glycerol-3-phosphate acyltransferase [Actinomycetes bacterium]
MEWSDTISKSEPRSATIKRRLKTIPMIFLLAVVVTALLPILLLIAAALDIVQIVHRKKPAAHVPALLFGEAYLLADIVGLTALFLTWITSGFGYNKKQLQATAFVCQQSWAGFMMGVSKFLFRLKLEVDGQDAARTGPYLEIIRHSSIVDNVLSAVCISGPLKVHLRYVIKKELLGDPVFDIAGQRLRNHFLDRDSGDPTEIAAIREMMQGMGPSEGALIYPEGTRVSSKRRMKALKAIARNRPERAEMFANLKHTLPPRHGGVLAMLDAAPNIDVVFFVHAGLEGIRGIKDVLEGGLTGRHIVVQIVRVAREQVPTGAEIGDWLDRTWLEVDRWVDEAITAMSQGTQVPTFAPAPTLPSA